MAQTGVVFPPSITVYANAPFDQPEADVILVSSDSIYFRVFKLFLSLAPPFFETLFRIPQPAEAVSDQEIRDGLAVIPVTEDSKTLDALLRFCYPCTLAEDPKLEVLKDVADVLEAARKYSLDVIEKKTRQAVMNPKILGAEPLQCFAIAYRGYLREETLLAARYTLMQPLIPSWFQLEIMAIDLLSLRAYHKQCADAVYALRLDLSWITSYYTSLRASWLSDVRDNHHCGCPRHTRFSYVVFGPSPQWWTDFMEETFAALRGKPCKETVEAIAEKTVQTVNSQSCQLCSHKLAQAMREFVDLFTRKIDETVAKATSGPDVCTLCLTLAFWVRSGAAVATTRAVQNDLEPHDACRLLSPPITAMFAAMSEDPTYASAPFDHRKADIILRSSDNIDFRVFKLFLSLASPFFETLFDIPQPTEGDGDQEVRDGLAVVPVTEDSKTLDALLRFCYPCTLAEDPKLEVLKDVADVLEAARKYSLDVIEKKARQAIVNPKILDAEPLRCFAIAYRGRLREETLLTARHTLTQPLIPSWFREIELLTAADLLLLLAYHKQCGEAVYALRLDLSWITSHYGSGEACSWLRGEYYHPDYGTSTCGCSRVKPAPKYKIYGVSLDWWEDFVGETFTALRDKPCKETVKAFAEKTTQTVKERNCQQCSPKITDGMRDFVDLFTRKIEETVSQIELELDF